MERNSITFTWKGLASLTIIAVTGLMLFSGDSLQKKANSAQPASHPQMLVADGTFPPPQLPAQPPPKNII